jgi:hypothetical protein
MLSLGQRLLWMLLVQVSTAASAQAQIYGRAHSDWQAYVIPQYGTRIDFPPGMFVPAGNPDMGVGQRFVSSDRRANLSIYALRNEAGDTPGSYLKTNLRVARSEIEYQRITRSFFALSMEGKGHIYYSRCNFSSGGGTIHCFDLEYPQEEKRAWDAIVTRISLSLRPLED